MIIDREPLAAKAVSTNFEVFGFKVDVAGDLKTAKKKIRDGKVDIVLLEAAGASREIEAFLSEVRDQSWEKPAVFLMSESENADLEKVFALGADGFLIKPLDASVTRDLIQQTCLSRKQRWMTPFRKETDFSLKRSIEAVSADSGDILFGRGGFCVSKSGKGAAAASVDQVVAFEIQVMTDKLCRKIAGTGLVRWAKKKGAYGVEIKFLADMGRDLYIEWMEKNQPVAFIPAAL